MPVRCSYTITSCITTSNYHYIFSGSENIFFHITGTTTELFYFVVSENPWRNVLLSVPGPDIEDPWE